MDAKNAKNKNGGTVPKLLLSRCKKCQFVFEGTTHEPLHMGAPTPSEPLR